MNLSRKGSLVLEGPVPHSSVIFMEYNRAPVILTNWGFNDLNNQFFWMSDPDGCKRKSHQLFGWKGQRTGLSGDLHARNEH